MKSTIPGSKGLPLSVQVASFPGREDIVFALMKEIEAHTTLLNDFSAIL